MSALIFFCATSESVEELAGDGDVRLGAEESFEDGACGGRVGAGEGGGDAEGLGVAGGEVGAGGGALDEGVECGVVVAVGLVEKAMEVNVSGEDELVDLAVGGSGVRGIGDVYGLDRQREARNAGVGGIDQLEESLSGIVPALIGNFRRSEDDDGMEVGVEGNGL